MVDVDNYNENRGIYSPLIEHNGVVCGYWLMGNNYRNPSKYYGAYPPSYLKRIQLLFPREFRSGLILHCFSGEVELVGTPEERARQVRFDINGSLTHTPDVVGDAAQLSQYFEEGTFDLILADPPYGDNHVKYGTKPVNKKKVVQECSKVLKDEGTLVWLDTIMPMWAKADGWKLRGTIGMCQSTNHQTRLVTILEQEYARRTR